MERNIEFIFTFSDESEKDQMVLSDTLTENMLRSKDDLFQEAIEYLDDDEVEVLEKISCAVYLEEEDDLEPPQWYIDCNGKLFVEGGQLC